MIKRRTRPQLRVRETSQEEDDAYDAQKGSADEEEDRSLPCVGNNLVKLAVSIPKMIIGFPNSSNFASYANQDKESIFRNSLKGM